MILRDAIEVNAPAAAIFAFFERLDETYVPMHPEHRVFRCTRGRGLAVGHRFYFEEVIAGKLLKKEMEYTRIEPDELIEFAPVHQPLRFFIPRMLWRLERIRDDLCRVVAEIHLRVGPLGESLDKREFDAVREHMRVEGVNLARMVERFVATGSWSADAVEPPQGAADDPIRAPTEAHEAHVQRLTDAHCLANQLHWLRRTATGLPMDMLWALLAHRAGLPWLLIAAWLALRGAMHLLAPRWSKRLEPWIECDPARGLALTRRVYAAFGLLMGLMFLACFVATDDMTKVLAMLLVSTYLGPVVISASGVQRTHWSTVGPSILVMLAGWILRGGWLGWIIAAMVLLSIPMTVLVIRQQRRAWEDLVRLQDDKQRLAVSLAAERDRAQAAAEARTRFFAAASHDLRQPLHALSVNVTTLGLLVRRAGNAQLSELSDGIGRALAQSQGLLDALLDISRLDAGAVALHPGEVDVAALMQQTHAAFAPVAAQRGLDFKLELPRTAAWARTDADQLQRIVRNLLDNAFKFTVEGGVTLALARVHRSPGPGDELRIRVADTGCGIAPGDRERVFEEFYQVGNPTRDRGRGLGLGLAIVRRTAKLLGVQVGLSARDGGPGTVFEIVLPALEGVGHVAPAAPMNVAHDATPALSILVVDDEPDIVQALCAMLRALGWQPHAARDSDAALALAGDAALRLDAAIIDHRLPGCTGVELALRLRARRPELPMLIVTGDVAVQWQARRHGLRLLHKPLDGGAIEKTIAEMVAAAARWHSRLDTFESPDGGPPMNIIDAMHGRRSIRDYLATPVARDVVEDLIRHAAQIPRPPISTDASWAFHVIEGRERLADFGARAKRWAADHQPPGEPWNWPAQGDFEVFWGAPLVVVICARRGHPEAPFDCCRAGQNLTLLAHARGLGSCWIGSALPWLQSEEGRDAVGLPAGFEASAVLTLGHAAQALPPQSAPRPAISWLN